MSRTSENIETAALVFFAVIVLPAWANRVDKKRYQREVREYLKLSAAIWKIENNARYGKSAYPPNAKFGKL